MKISRKSWSYRLLEVMEIEQPNNFCEYFSIVLLTTMVSIVGALVFAIITILGFLFGFWPNFHHGSNIFHKYKMINEEKRFPVAPWEIILPIFLIFSIIKMPVVGFLTMIIISAIIVILILLKWILELKEKICPRIEFVD